LQRPPSGIAGWACAYEQNAGRVEFRAPEANLSDAIRKLDADPKTDRGKPTWLTALEQVRLPLYDVHWTPAVVVEKRAIRRRGFASRRPQGRPHAAAVDLRRAHSRQGRAL